MILVGDYIPKKKNVEFPEEFGSSVVVANLESPIVSDDLPHRAFKSGPNLYSVSLGLNNYEQKTSNYKLVFTLANNHMMDYGEEGLNRTIAYLKSRNIPFGGAGRNLEESRRPILIDENGKRIAIICCREPQFGSARPNILTGEQPNILTSGCADYGYWVFDLIRALKAPGHSGDNRTIDYVIVSCHAALEHSPFPSPRLREYYHRLIAAGADVIHGHHSHVPQGWEEVVVPSGSFQDSGILSVNDGKCRKGLVFYGLGNFVVDPVAWSGSNPNYLWSNVVYLMFGENGVSYKVTPYRVEGHCDVIVPKMVSEVLQTDGKLQMYISQYNAIACGALESQEKLTGYWQATCSILFDKLYGIPLHCPGFGEHRLSFRNRARYLYDVVVDVWSVIRGKKIVNRMSLTAAANFYNCFLCDSHVEAVKTACGLAFQEELDCRDSGMWRDCKLLEVEKL